MASSFRLRAALLGALVSISPILALSPAAQPGAPAPGEEAAACASLAQEWRTAEAACSANANLGRARALAREAETKCRLPESAQHKLGIAKYQSALRLCRKPAGSP